MIAFLVLVLILSFDFENGNEINNGTSEFNTIKEEDNDGNIDDKSGNDN